MVVRLMLQSTTGLLQQAKDFLSTCYAELEKSESCLQERIEEVEREIRDTGTYEHTYEELQHGARMAWRNSNRCIGRLFWKSLNVFDERSARSPQEVKRALLNHISYATNGGKIRPTITVFSAQRPETEVCGVRIWNHQLVRYAGYETDKGLRGDPDSLAFTKICTSLGWRGDGSEYDVLPLVVQVDGQRPEWFAIARDEVLEVPIRHPDCSHFAELGLQWYAVPMISDMALEIGGIRYPAAPFNGWYMGTEIGARNLADRHRYNKLPEVAEVFELDVHRERTLWRDRALVELNRAVLYSFQESGVRIVDHHTAARQFEQFERTETDAHRAVTGDWTWLIPPVSPAATHIFHRNYDNRMVTPNYLRQPPPYPPIIET